MVFKLVESAQARGRAITGAHLVPLVRAGALFENGHLVRTHRVDRRLTWLDRSTEIGNHDPGQT